MYLDERELKRRLVLRLKSVESGRLLIGPATVQIHLTDLCNLTCQYCYYYGLNSEYRPTGKNHLPLDIFSRIVQDCVDLQVDTINLSGQGDPSLHPRFYEMLDKLHQNPVSVSINSNGTFPLKRCRDILKADRIVINLGEADRASYRALQGKDLFIKVIKNIKELARLRPLFNPNFKIEVVFITTRLNEGSLLRTESLVRKLGADSIQKKVAEISKHNKHIMLLEQEDKIQSDGTWPPCYHGWFYSAIKLNGDINVCCYMQRLTIGNVFKTSFKSIWQSEEYSRARASALTGDPFRNYHECLNCTVAKRNKEIGAQVELYNRMRS